MILEIVINAIKLHSGDRKDTATSQRSSRFIKKDKTHKLDIGSWTPDGTLHYGWLSKSSMVKLLAWVWLMSAILEAMLVLRLTES